MMVLPTFFLDCPVIACYDGQAFVASLLVMTGSVLRAVYDTFQNIDSYCHYCISAEHRHRERSTAIQLYVNASRKTAVAHVDCFVDKAHLTQCPHFNSSQRRLAIRKSNRAIEINILNALDYSLNYPVAAWYDAQVFVSSLIAMTGGAFCKTLTGFGVLYSAHITGIVRGVFYGMA
jgi:hypothetical protein